MVEFIPKDWGLKRDVHLFPVPQPPFRRGTPIYVVEGGSILQPITPAAPYARLAYEGTLRLGKNLQWLCSSQQALANFVQATGKL